MERYYFSSLKNFDKFLRILACVFNIWNVQDPNLAILPPTALGKKSSF